MTVSERILQAQQAAVQRGEVANSWRLAPTQSLAADGLGDFKARVHDALFERLGTRLFEAATEEQMHSLIMAEIGTLMLEKFLIAFEAASLLLLLAAVGAIVLANRRPADEDGAR